MYDIVVIGGGAAGLNVASAASRIGAKVALIEKAKLGGECTNTACVPSKALLRAARIAHEIRLANEFGIHPGEVRVDFPAVMARVRAVVESFRAGETAERLSKKVIEVIAGSPRFESYDTVVIDGTRRISAAKFAIATGSRPDLPPIPGLLESGYLTNETIWNLNALPESLAILGGGPVAIEFGQAFARLGSKVTIIEKNSEILHREDRDATAILRQRLAAEGIGFVLGVEATGIGIREGSIVVKHRSGSGEASEVRASYLLVATGRIANVEGLNLVAIGIHASAERGIPVDDYLATAARNVYALGDVIARDRFTHAAERMAAVVFQNALLKLPKKYRDDAIPRVVFSDPEFAAVGITEAQATERGIEAKIVALDLAKVDRVRIDGDEGGLLKVVATPGGKVLGATIVGPDASLAIQELVLAIEHGLTLGDLAGTVHPYPTMASAVRSVANRFAASRLDGGFVRTALKWVYGLTPPS